MGAAKSGAPFFKNQAGILSSPVAVGSRASRIFNTCHLVTCDEAFSKLAVSLISGAFKLASV